MRFLLAKLCCVVLAAAWLVAPGRSTAAPGDGSLAPFRPPLGWQSFPLFGNENIVSWDAADTSTLEIHSFPASPASKPATDFSKFLMPGQVLLQSTTIDVCDTPIRRAQIFDKKLDVWIVVQQQTFDSHTYFTRYVRPNGVDTDEGIVRFLDGFCGPKSVSGSKPPAGWHDNAAQKIGWWFDFSQTLKDLASGSTSMSTSSSAGQESLTLISLKPDSDVRRLARAALRAANVAEAPIIVSTSDIVLCGAPAVRITATGSTRILKPSTSVTSQIVKEDGSSPPAPVPEHTPSADEIANAQVLVSVTIELEITQTATGAYALLYTHPADAQPKPAAVASLATLCAP